MVRLSDDIFRLRYVLMKKSKMCFGAPLILISQILQFFQALLKTSSLGSSQYVEPEHDSEPPEKTLAPDQARV